MYSYGNRNQVFSMNRIEEFGNYGSDVKEKISCFD